MIRSLMFLFLGFSSLIANANDCLFNGPYRLTLHLGTPNVLEGTIGQDKITLTQTNFHGTEFYSGVFKGQTLYFSPDGFGELRTGGDGPVGVKEYGGFSGVIHGAEAGFSHNAGEWVNGEEVYSGSQVGFADCVSSSPPTIFDPNYAVDFSLENPFLYNPQPPAESRNSYLGYEATCSQYTLSLLSQDLTLEQCQDVVLAVKTLQFLSSSSFGYVNNPDFTIRMETANSAALIISNFLNQSFGPGNQFDPRQLTSCSISDSDLAKLRSFVSKIDRDLKNAGVKPITFSYGENVCSPRGRSRGTIIKTGGAGVIGSPGGQTLPQARK